MESGAGREEGAGHREEEVGRWVRHGRRSGRAEQRGGDAKGCDHAVLHIRFLGRRGQTANELEDQERTESWEEVRAGGKGWAATRMKVAATADHAQGRVASAAQQVAAPAARLPGSAESEAGQLAGWVASRAGVGPRSCWGEGAHMEAALAGASKPAASAPLQGSLTAASVEPSCGGFRRAAAADARRVLPHRCNRLAHRSPAACSSDIRWPTMCTCAGSRGEERSMIASCCRTIRSGWVGVGWSGGVLVCGWVGGGRAPGWRAGAGKAAVPVKVLTTSC